MSIISFIRKEKNTNVDEAIEKIKIYDSSITTQSKTLIFYELFKRNYIGLNIRRFVELAKWINVRLNELPSTSSVEQAMTKIRKECRGDEEKYKASLKFIVFDRIQKQKNIDVYNKKIEMQTRNSEEIKISLINKIFEDVREDNGDFKMMLIYLLLSSGSRYREICDGVFKNIGGGRVSLSNIAKTKDKERKIEKELLDKNGKRFMRVLKKYRQLNKDEQTGIGQLNIYLKQKYEFSSYHFRKMYCNVSYWLLDDKTIQKNSYLADILGHSTDDIARIYSGFYVTEDEEIRFRKEANTTSPSSPSSPSPPSPSPPSTSSESASP